MAGAPPPDASKVLNADGVSVVLGSQWGDEGKGKLVDILAQHADYVCRCQGGNNAGHTIKVGGTTYDFHVVPSGIVSPHCKSLIGNGVVLHLEQFFQELEHNIALDEKKGTTAMKGWESRLMVSNRAHIVFDVHQQVDGLREQERGGGSIGTTKRGIGPTYASKANRTGFRVADLYGDWDAFRERFAKWVAHVKVRFPALEVDVDAELAKTKKLAERLKPFVCDTVTELHKVLNKKKVLVEGANALMLDLDFGTYPFVTSSSTSAGGVCTGLGIPPRDVRQVFGVVKAYSTRVGAGGFPTEQPYGEGEVGATLRDIGREFGVTTGRPRRCGWLDLVVLKWSHMINGYSSLMVTKLDVLDTFKEIKVATGYTLDGAAVEGHPVLATEDLERVEVVYETLPGWDTPITGCKTFVDLPANAQKYIKFIEDILGTPVQWVGVGPGREDTIQLF